jgi:WD40 repeat protein
MDQLRGKTISATAEGKMTRRESALPPDVVAHAMEWLTHGDVASAAAVCRGWSGGCSSEKLWRLQYARTFSNQGGGGGGKQGEDVKGDGSVVSALPPPPPVCSDSKVVCADGASTLWRSRFARRLSIERNWEELSRGDRGAADASRFASHTFGKQSRSVTSICVWWGLGVLITSSMDNNVRVWELESGACERVLEGHTSVVWCLAGDSSQDLVVSGSGDRTLRVWQVSTGQCLQILAAGTGVYSVALLPNKVIVSGGDGGVIKVWDGEQGTCTKTLTGGGTVVGAVVSDGKRIFSGQHSGDIRMFEMESGACTETLLHAPREVRYVPCAVRCLLLSPSGDALVAGCDDGKIRAWDLLSDDRTPREFEKTESKWEDSVYSLSWQEGVGLMRVVVGHLGGVRVYDFETGRSVFSLACPFTIAAADLHRLVSAPRRKDVKLLDLSA